MIIIIIIQIYFVIYHSMTISIRKSKMILPFYFCCCCFIFGWKRLKTLKDENCILLMKRWMLIYYFVLFKFKVIKYLAYVNLIDASCVPNHIIWIEIVIISDFSKWVNCCQNWIFFKFLDNFYWIFSYRSKIPSSKSRKKMKINSLSGYKQKFMSFSFTSVVFLSLFTSI